MKHTQFIHYDGGYHMHYHPEFGRQVFVSKTFIIAYHAVTSLHTWMQNRLRKIYLTGYVVGTSSK